MRREPPVRVLAETAREASAVSAELASPGFGPHGRQGCNGPLRACRGITLLVAEDALSAWLAAQRLALAGLGRAVVVVVPFNEENATALARGEPTEVCWRHRVRGSLPSLLKLSRLRRLGSSVASFTELGRFADSVAECCLVDVPPPASVNDLARMLHITPGGLRYRWRSNRLPGTPSDFVQLASLARVARFRGEGDSIAAALTKAAVPGGTARRRASRWLGCAVSDISSDLVSGAVRAWVKRSQFLSR